MNFEELGKTLKEERERRGLTVAAVMEATKISRTNIEAMEAGNRSTLPHPVYAKGFIKSYARLLGLDADELGMVVDREFGEQECEPRGPAYDVSPNAEKAFHGRECVSPEGRRSRVVLVVALLFLLVVVGLLLYSFSTGDRDTASQPTGVEQSMTDGSEPLVDDDGDGVPDVPPEGTPPDEDAVPGASGQEGLSSDASGEAPGAQSASGARASAASGAAADRTADRVVDRTGEPEEESFSTSDVEAGTQRYDHVVIIRATTSKGCWVGVWQGEETNMSRDFVLREGEPLRLMFNSPRRIRIGNVAGVTVTYNGKPYPLENARGNIQTLRFGMD
ncbi:helix-turn-helix domain-containing protein [Pseudodesulfovibrio pelocollis]|uniref:helix-turn-helix domain-containing protein n=1 Tax=Pseudodesulfovibrio pelocollis TaxID=3051432 RepID=UPI00255A8E2E|nr:helix-turn-helix domain-containing protein [Pseudodesulfovibrio sp. SB368]